MDDLRRKPEPIAGRSTEWPTLVLAAVIHGAWMLSTFYWNRFPPAVLIAVGGWLTAWHGSLQHEVIHGHPTRWRWLNTALASLPLSLWLPFETYRRSHLGHHAAEALTDPLHDPKSRYLPAGEGALHEVRRGLARLQGPLIGRLALGPIIEIAGSLAAQARAVARGDSGARAAWALHALGLAPLLAWLHFVCHLPLVGYGLCFVYPGAALTLLRSFAEHRAAPAAAQRVAVVERAPVLGLLFLNNNLHAAHHAWPAAPWFRLNGLYAEHRARLLSANGGLVYDGYRDVAGRYLFRAHDRTDYEAAPADCPAS